MYETDCNYYKTMTLFSLFPKNKKLKYEFTSNNKEKTDNNYNYKENSDNNNINKTKIKKNLKTNFLKNEKKNANIISSSSRVTLYNKNTYIPTQSKIQLHKTSSNFYSNKKIRINQNQNVTKNKNIHLNNETDNIEREASH